MGEGDDGVETNVPAGVWVFHAVWLTGLLVGIASWLLQGSPDRAALIQTYILALTLLAVAWYTFETRRMHLAVRDQVAAAARQTNVSILPIFILQVYIKGDFEPLSPIPGGIVGRDRLELTNVGNGSAFNIEIEPLELKFGRELPSGYPIPWLVFESVMKADPKETVAVSFRNRMEHADGSLSFGHGWPAHLVPGRTYFDYELRINFMDIVGNHYVQPIYLGSDGYRLGVIEEVKERRVKMLPRFDRFKFPPGI